MPVETWKPDALLDHPSEGAALLRLQDELRRSTQQFWILPSILIKGSQIDFLIFSKTGLFIIELKYTDDQPIHGGVNGSWKRQDGIPFGENNPVKQIIKQYHNLRAWLQENQSRFLTANQCKSLRRGEPGAFSDIKKFIVLYPTKHPETALKLEGEKRIHPTYGDVIGFDQLVPCLENPAWQSQLGIEFNDKIVASIAKLLGLEHSDLNSDQRQAKEAPMSGKKSGNRRQWVWSTISLGTVIVIVLAFFFTRDLLNNAPRVYSPSDAKAHINEIASVRTEITGWNPSGNSALLLYAEGFTIEIKPVQDIEASKEKYTRWVHKCVVVGPKKIGTAKSSGNPQMELTQAEAETLIIESNVPCP